MANALINSMVTPFDPSKYKDEYQVKLRELLETKIAGKEIVASKSEAPSNIINLMDALKASIEQNKTKETAKAKTQKNSKRCIMDMFDSKNIKPMLIGEMQEAFDSPDYIYELKLDGERCIAYLDNDITDLRNKRNIKMLVKVPELSMIHKQVKCRCILDGELIVIKDGKPDFFEIQRRSLMSNTFKIKLASSKLPASFTAFDILYYEDHEVIDLPLMQRKKLLEKTIKENDRIAISRYIEERGIEFYKLAKQNQLEGIVAKRKDSKYYLDKRTKDWIKIKNLMDDDFVVCGYIFKAKWCYQHCSWSIF